MLKRAYIILTMLFCLADSVGKGDIIMWTVNSSATIDGIAIQTFLSPYTVDDEHWVAGRIKISDGNGRILNSWCPEYTDPDTGEYYPAGWESGINGVELLDNGSGNWGAFDNHSETGHNTIQSVQDMFNGITPQYNSDVMEALFAIEIGYNTMDSSIGDWVWKTIAESKSETYRDLLPHMYAQGDIAPIGMDWTPTEFHTVPEPSTFLLLLLGLGILALRRNYGQHRIVLP